MLALAGCEGAQAAQVAQTARAGQTEPRPPVAGVDPGAVLAARPELPPEKRAIVMVGGQERIVDAEEAVRAGFTLVSLREDWTPYIFLELPGADGRPLPNRYRTIYLGLATDTADSDGQPLSPPDSGKAGHRSKPAKQRLPGSPAPHNFLEVYGIPPTLSVLRARFLEDAPENGADRCADVDVDKILAVPVIPTPEPKEEKRARAKLAALRRQLETKRRAARVATLDELAAAQPKLANDVEAVKRADLAAPAWPEVEKRLRCEGLLSPAARHTPGSFDEPMREAVIRFQRKHKIYEGAALRKQTMATLARPLLEGDQAALERVLTERAVSAADVLEDGTTDRTVSRPKEGEPRTVPATYKGARGEPAPIRNLVEEVSRATIEQLGLTSPEASLAFFRRHPAADFQWLRAAVKLPPRPEYYSPEMDLSIEIDRGDVFYDPPYDEKGKHLDQSRKHYPKLTVRVRWNGQLIPLVRWRTTIGGWRSDLASNGYEYFRYKGSDVGPRAWRHIVAGPVWIAPTSTPIRTLVKSKRVNGSWQTVVNYDEVGPGFLSAYGLVAAYNVVPGKEGKPDWDNGIRVHGSSEFRSMFDPDGYSHGCHRLVNHLAERMYSFILQHHKVSVEGDQTLGFARQFLWKEDVYEMRLPTRGYRFVLDPPIPVMVTEGNILGTLKKPVTTYVPKPGVQYPPGPMPVPRDSPEARAGGGGE
ncbi:MAG TPA: peptidoglycan-binding domain-containing protein [Polyangia bacterium]|nr:peptidoglycan-binding domain-containing protein [Polyangia bacterium]